MVLAPNPADSGSQKTFYLVMFAWAPILHSVVYKEGKHEKEDRRPVQSVESVSANLLGIDAGVDVRPYGFFAGEELSIADG
jgi:hypothetical protein